MSTADAVNGLFAHFDTGNKGFLDRNELKTVLGMLLKEFGHTLTEQEMDSAIKEIDTNNDGTASKAELIVLVDALLAARKNKE